ncbi:MAG TPA: XRE family transcriptional regulator [Paludibacteraceae bacterium]|nr:XRE family transcriptional regulator [Paludibacteraceae bacterium]
MLFADIIKELRKKKQIVNRKFDTTLEIENPMHHKIERGDRRAKREQITVIARLLQIDETELVMLWLADKFIATIGAEKELAPQAFKVALHNANKK